MHEVRKGKNYFVYTLVVVRKEEHEQVVESEKQRKQWSCSFQNFIVFGIKTTYRKKLGGHITNTYKDKKAIDNRDVPPVDTKEGMGKKWEKTI